MLIFLSIAAGLLTGNSYVQSVMIRSIHMLLQNKALTYSIIYQCMYITIDTRSQMHDDNLAICVSVTIARRHSSFNLAFRNIFKLQVIRIKTSSGITKTDM
jgi:hypothetical protein